MFKLPIKQRFPSLTSLGPITTHWGGQTAYEAFHPAVDIANKKGTPIPAPTPGVVTNVTTGRKNGDAGFGNVAIIKDANGNRHQFGHLDQVSVKPGDSVQAGNIIGTMGNSGAAYSPSGKSDGTHLDYRVASAFGRYMNPMVYLRNFNTYA